MSLLEPRIERPSRPSTRLGGARLPRLNLSRIPRHRYVGEDKTSITLHDGVGEIRLPKATLTPSMQDKARGFEKFEGIEHHADADGDPSEAEVGYKPSDYERSTLAANAPEAIEKEAHDAEGRRSARDRESASDRNARIAMLDYEEPAAKEAVPELLPLRTDVGARPSPSLDMSPVVGVEGPIRFDPETGQALDPVVSDALSREQALGEHERQNPYTRGLLAEARQPSLIDASGLDYEMPTEDEVVPHPRRLATMPASAATQRASASGAGSGFRVRNKRTESHTSVQGGENPNDPDFALSPTRTGVKPAEDNELMRHARAAEAALLRQGQAQQRLGEEQHEYLLNQQVRADSERNNHETWMKEHDALIKSELDKPIGDHRGLGTKLLSGLAMGLGTFGSAMAKIPNYAQQFIEKSIAEDLEAQKSNKSSRLNLYQQQGHDHFAARQLALSDSYQQVAHMIKGMEAKYGGQINLANSEQLAHEYAIKSQKERAEAYATKIKNESMPQQLADLHALNIAKNQASMAESAAHYAKADLDRRTGPSKSEKMAAETDLARARAEAARRGKGGVSNAPMVANPFLAPQAISPASAMTPDEDAKAAQADAMLSGRTHGGTVQRLAEGGESDAEEEESTAPEQEEAPEAPEPPTLLAEARAPGPRIPAGLTAAQQQVYLSMPPDVRAAYEKRSAIREQQAMQAQNQAEKGKNAYVGVPPGGSPPTPPNPYGGLGVPFDIRVLNTPGPQWEKLRKRAVPLAAGIIGMANSEEDAKKAKNLLSTAKEIEDSVSELRAFRQEHSGILPGGTLLPTSWSAEGRRAEAIRKNIVTSMNAMKGLSRLNTHEFEAFLEMVPDATKILGQTDAGFERNLSQFEGFVRSKVRAELGARLQNLGGGQPSASAIPRGPAQTLQAGQY